MTDGDDQRPPCPRFLSNQGMKLPWDRETLYSLLQYCSPSPTSPLLFHRYCLSGTRSLPNQHPQNRVWGAETGRKLYFCDGQYPLLVRIRISDGDTPCAAALKQLLILSQSEGVRLMMSIFQSTPALTRPYGSISTMPTPLKPFNVPPGSPP